MLPKKMWKWARPVNLVNTIYYYMLRTFTDTLIVILFKYVSLKLFFLCLFTVS